MGAQRHRLLPPLVIPAASQMILRTPVALAFVYTIVLAVNETSVGGPVCLQGDPPVQCIEGTSVVSALKVAGVCQVKMYPMKLAWGTCEEKGFVCPKKMPNETFFANMKMFDLPSKAGNCSTPVNVTGMNMLVTPEAVTAMAKAAENELMV